MIDINETIAVSVLNIVLPRLTLMKFFSFIIFFSPSEKSPSCLLYKSPSPRES